MNVPTRDCWFLSGPTASGKTAIGLELAEQLNAEIVSMDSMAIYRGMDIGTAKPTHAERSRIPHHLTDIVDPDKEYSLASYIEAARESVAEIRQRGKEVLFVGGTPLYLKALLRGIFDGPPADWDFREQVQADIDQSGVAELHERLKQVDPLSASKLPPGDVRRIIRALEVYKLTGRPISHWQMQFDEGAPAESGRVFVLQWPRELLHRRIADRVDDMLARGLISEIQELKVKYASLSRTASQAVGYREGLAHLELGTDLETTIEKIKTRTRRFAKRQGTWFRSLSECRMIDRSAHTDAKAVANWIRKAKVELF